MVKSLVCILSGGMQKRGRIPKRDLFNLLTGRLNLVGSLPFGGRGPTGGRLGANTTPRTQNAKRCRRSPHGASEGEAIRRPAPQIPTLQTQARAIPPGEVQPIPANDSTRTEPAGAVQPRNEAQQRTRENANNVKKRICV